MIRYSNLIWLSACLAFPVQAFAGTVVKLDPSLASSGVTGKHLKKEAAHHQSVAFQIPTPPQTQEDSTKKDLAESSGLRLVTFRNLHEDMNPIFANDSEPAFDSRPEHSESSRPNTLGAVIGAAKDNLVTHLARLTAYWVGEAGGDYYTNHHVSSTGIHLHGGHCAVDPSIIPYGSVVEIPGVGQFIAVDTGSAVVSRTAARRAGHTDAERGALVIDLFFENSTDGEKFAASGPEYVTINWWTPKQTASTQPTHRFLAAE